MTASIGRAPRLEAPTWHPQDAWLRAGGATFPALEIEARGDDRAVRARRDIRAGEQILTVPLDRIVTRAVVERSPIGQHLLGLDIPVTSQTLFAAFLLVEGEAPASPWRPYLDALPRALPTLPIHYAETDLARLDASFARDRVEEQRRALAWEHHRVCSRLPSFARFSRSQYLHARLTVLTRIFGLAVDGEATEALVPMADMLNHRVDARTSWGFDQAQRAFVMTATGDFAAGDEVHDSYGTKCNSRFFLHYGFCLADNPDNEAVLELGPVDDGRRRALVRRFAGPAAVDGRFQVPAPRACPQVRALGSFLRIACADDRELERIAAIPGDAVPVVSRENEARALGLLARQALAALRRFSTSVSDDEALLADATLSAPARACVMMRMGEKQVLHQHLARACARLAGVSMS